MLEDIFPFFEYFSLFVALIFTGSYKKQPYFKYLLTYLFTVVIFETIGYYLRIKDLERKYLFDIFLYFEFILVTFIYRNLLTNKKVKKISIVMILIFFTFHSFLFFEQFYWVKKYSLIVESIFISVFAILYFKQLLNSNEILNYRKLLPFWLSVAFIIFFLPSIPFFILVYSGIIKNRELFPILHALIIIYNCCFIYGLIKCRKVK